MRTQHQHTRKSFRTPNRSSSSKQPAKYDQIQTWSHADGQLVLLYYYCSFRNRHENRKITRTTRSTTWSGGRRQQQGKVPPIRSILSTPRLDGFISAIHNSTKLVNIQIGASEDINCQRIGASEDGCAVVYAELMMEK